VTETLHGLDGEIPPTGRRVQGHVADISRIEHGKLAESRLYFDQAELLSQLAVMPQSART
jgi:predicted ester cyclase